jgi:hypothetical protein
MPPLSMCRSSSRSFHHGLLSTLPKPDATDRRLPPQSRTARTALRKMTAFRLPTIVPAQKAHFNAHAQLWPVIVIRPPRIFRIRRGRW